MAPYSTGHPEIAGYYYDIPETIENPLCIYEGTRNEYIAVSGKQEQSGKFIVVIYRETEGGRNVFESKYF